MATSTAAGRCRNRQGIGVSKVAAFREKPSADAAERFVASGEYFWNSGIFVWRADAILGAFAEFQPVLHQAVERIAAAWDGPSRNEVCAREYAGLAKISIDYAVMERAHEVLVVQAPYRWDDVGSWLALERMNPQDENGNTILRITAAWIRATASSSETATAYSRR